MHILFLFCLVIILIRGNESFGTRVQVGRNASERRPTIKVPTIQVKEGSVECVFRLDGMQTRQSGGEWAAHGGRMSFSPGQDAVQSAVHRDAAGRWREEEGRRASKNLEMSHQLLRS